MSKITVNQAPREGVLDEQFYINNLNGDIKVNKEMPKRIRVKELMEIKFLFLQYTDPQKSMEGYKII